LSASINLKTYTEFPSEIIDEIQVPVFCSPQYANYLKQVNSQEVSWFTGFLNETMICIIPFSIIKKAIFKKGIFLTSVVFLSEFNETLEKVFLESVINHIRENKTCDWIQQPPNWAIFRSVPSNSIYCEFGTYRIDLKDKEKIQILKKMHRDHRQHIIHAIKNTDIVVKKGPELVDDCIEVFTVSSARKFVELPTKEDIDKMLEYLPGNIQIYVSYYNTVPQSSIIYFPDNICYYAVYAAMIAHPAEGINHILHW